MENKNWFKIIFIGLLIWTAVGVAGVVLFEFFMPNIGNSNSTPWAGWSVLEAIAKWMLVGGLGAAIWQIYESSKNTKINTTIQVYKNLRTPEELDRLNKVFQLTPEDLTYDNPDSRLIISAMENFEMLGYLVYSKAIDEELVIKAYGGVTSLKLWYRIQPFVVYMRKLQGYHWGIYTEYIASIAYKRWKDHPKLILYHWEDPQTKVRQAEDIFKLYEKTPEKKPKLKEDIEAIIAGV